MLEVKVYGGLGNQMFQYAFYLYLKKQNSEVIMNVSDFNIHNHHYGFELEKVFKIDGPFSLNECSFALNSNKFYIRVLKKILGANIVSEKEYYEDPDISYVELTKYERNLYFIGYWQDVRYVEANKEELINAFNFGELDRQNFEFWNKWKDCETISIHVRRGDYLTSKALGEICNEEYYFKAIDFIESRVSEPKYMIFSDDPEWCKEKFKNIDAEIIDWNIGMNSYVDMHLMSLCKHNIIANSTFSWWGAYLNKNPKKIVICPKKWNLKYKRNRLVAKKWIAI